MVKVSEESVRNKLTSRNCKVSLNMFNDAIRKGESDVVDEFRYMLGKYDPRVHRLTPFGASIDLALLAMKVFTNDTQTWYEKAFVNNYDYTEETGVSKPSPLCEVLSGFQLKPKGAYVMEIMEKTQMLKRQITSALDILKLKKSFTWGGAREIKRRVGQSKIVNKEKVTPAKLRKNVLERYSTLKGLSAYCYGRPIQTISVKSHFPISWMARNYVKRDHFLAARVAEFGVREFAGIAKMRDSVYLYPANDDFGLHEFDIKNAIRDNDEEFKLETITHRKDVYYRIEDSETFYKGNAEGEESILPMEILEELHDYRVAYINSLYRMVNARVYRERLWTREKDTFDAERYERELKRYQTDDCESLEENLS
jgi:hypothetical protein